MKTTPKDIFYLTIIFVCLLIANNIDIVPIAFIKVILACLAFLFIPGDLLYSLFLKERSDIGCFEGIPVVFCLGLGFFGIWGVLAYLVHFTWGTLQTLTLCSGIGLLTVTLRRASLHPAIHNPRPHSLTDSPQWRSTTDRTAVIIFTVLLLTITLISFWLSGSVSIKPETFSLIRSSEFSKQVLAGHRTADRIVHWGYIKKLTETTRISNQWISLNYSYNIWHLFVAMVSKFAGVNYRWVWSWFVLYCTPLTLLAVFSFGKALFKNERLALICAFVFLLNGTLFNNYFSDSGLWNWMGTPNPRDIGFILMTMIGSFIFSYIKQGEKVYFWLAVFIGAITLFVHDIDFLFINIILFLFTITFVIFKRQDKTVIKGLSKLIIILCLVAVPLVIIKSPSTVTISNPAATNPEMAGSRTANGNQILGVRARELGIPPTPIIFLSFMLSLFLFPRIRDDDAALFLIATTALPPLLAYNPALPFFISKFLATFNIRVPVETIVPVTGLRTACILPVTYVCAYGICRIISGIKTRTNNSLTIGLSAVAGVTTGLIAGSQFSLNYLTPLTKLFKDFKWPFYPPWAIVLLVVLNLFLFAGEWFFRFPGKLLDRNRQRSVINNEKQIRKIALDSLIPIVVITVASLVLAVPAEIRFFRGPVHFQTLTQLAEGPGGFKFLSENIAKNARILSDPITSFYLPAYTGHDSIGFKAYGKWKSGGRGKSLLAVFDYRLSTKNRLDLLKKHKIEYLYLNWGATRKELKRELNKPHYSTVYEDDHISIYKVLDNT